MKTTTFVYSAPVTAGRPAIMGLFIISHRLTISLYYKTPSLKSNEKVVSLTGSNA